MIKVEIVAGNAWTESNLNNRVYFELGAAKAEAEPWESQSNHLGDRTWIPSMDLWEHAKCTSAF